MEKHNWIIEFLPILCNSRRFNVCVIWEHREIGMTQHCFGEVLLLLLGCFQIISKIRRMDHRALLYVIWCSIVPVSWLLHHWYMWWLWYSIVSISIYWNFKHSRMPRMILNSNYLGLHFPFVVQWLCCSCCFIISSKLKITPQSLNL